VRSTQHRPQRAAISNLWLRMLLIRRCSLAPPRLRTRTGQLRAREAGHSGVDAGELPGRASGAAQNIRGTGGIEPPTSRMQDDQMTLSENHTTRPSSQVRVAARLPVPYNSRGGHTAPVLASAQPAAPPNPRRCDGPCTRPVHACTRVHIHTHPGEGPSPRLWQAPAPAPTGRAVAARAGCCVVENYQSLSLRPLAPQARPPAGSPAMATCCQRCWLQHADAPGTLGHLQR
jgi:hypothetical protein